MMMPKQRVLLQPAYVLHQKPYRDSSALVDIFTPEHGRVALVANGIKRSTSKIKGLIQPFFPLLVSWSGRGDLFTLNSVEAQGQALMLQQQCLASGLYINELIMRLTQRRESQVELFSTYDQILRTLQKLNQLPKNNFELQNALRQFELKLLYSLGYGLELNEDVNNGAAIDSEQVYDYQLEVGPICLGHSEDQQVYGIKISGDTLLALANDQLLSKLDSPRVFYEAKQLMRFVLDRYLGEKPLMSRQLFARSTSTINGSQKH